MPLLCCTHGTVVSEFRMPAKCLADPYCGLTDGYKYAVSKQRGFVYNGWGWAGESNLYGEETVQWLRSIMMKE